MHNLKYIILFMLSIGIGTSDAASVDLKSNSVKTFSDLQTRLAKDSTTEKIEQKELQIMQSKDAINKIQANEKNGVCDKSDGSTCRYGQHKNTVRPAIFINSIQGPMNNLAVILTLKHTNGLYYTGDMINGDIKIISIKPNSLQTVNPLSKVRNTYYIHNDANNSKQVAHMAGYPIISAFDSGHSRGATL